MSAGRSWGQRLRERTGRLTMGVFCLALLIGATLAPAGSNSRVLTVAGGLGLLALVMWDDDSYDRALNERLRELEARSLKMARGEMVNPAPRLVDDEIGRIAEATDQIARISAIAATRFREAVRSARIEVFEISPDADEIVLLDGGRVFDHLGFAPAEVPRSLGEWMGRIHDEDLTNVLAALADRSGGETRVEFRIRTPAGGFAWLMARGRYYGKSPEGNGRGVTQPVLLRRPSGFFIGVFVDVTDRVLAVDALRVARENAERALKVKGEFMSRISHELRTPLNSVLGFAQVIALDPEAKPEHTTQAEHILDAGKLLLRLVNDILDFESLRLDHVGVVCEPTDGDAMIREVVAMMQSAAMAAGTRFQLTLAPCPPILADRQRVRQVVLNLLSNAIKYGAAGTVVDVRAGHDAQGFFLQVRDTGPGMSEEAQSRIFEPFERLHHYSRVEGSGLGLAISKTLVERMNGSLSVESTLGLGSTFTLRLPLAAGGTVRQTERIVRPQAVEPIDVVYVEDEELNRRVMEAMLRAHPFVKLHLHPSVEGALDLIRRVRPRLVFLDLHLRDGSGDDVLKAIRLDPEVSTTEVVVASADVLPQTIDRLSQLGANGFLPKPLMQQALLDQIARVQAS